MAFGHFLLDSHNFMVPALGSCVKMAPSVHVEFLPIIGQNPSDSKSNRSHVVIFQLFIDKFEVNSIDSSTNDG